MPLRTKWGPGRITPPWSLVPGWAGSAVGRTWRSRGCPSPSLEQHGIPGGYATAFERGAGRFRFEVSLHGTSINHNAAARILQNVGVLDRLQLVELPEIYRLKTPTLDIAVPQKDPEAFIQLLSRTFPGQESGIRSFVNEMVGLAEEVGRLDQNKGKFFKLFFPLQYRRMWKIRNKTLLEFMNEHVTDPAVQNVLGSLWGYYGLPPSTLSAFYYANATGDYLRKGSFYIKERSQNLSDALAETIEARGGRILYNTLAEKIEVQNGAVKGVVLAGGSVLPARAVVSNASALTTFRQMVPRESVPPDYLKRLESLRPSISSFIVWLGLNRELRGRVQGCGTHVGTGRGPEADYRACIQGEVEEGPFSVTVYDNLYPGYSRPGTSSLMLLFLCGFEPWRRFEDDYRAGRKNDYRNEKERWADVLVRRAEEVVPGLSSMIEVREAATPLTNQRYTGNPAGAIYGFEQSMDNAFMNRIENRTPIRGLYLAGAWTNPGGGYTGVLRAGERAFEQIMEDWAG